MRAHSYRILTAFTTGDLVSISICKDEYRDGRLMKSDLVSLKNTTTAHLWMELHRASAWVYNDARACAATRLDPGPLPGDPGPDDACTASEPEAVRGSSPRA